MPYPPAHSRASSISLPAISADATRWSGAAGRRGANGSSRAAEAPRQGRARAAQAARVPRAAAPPMALRRELAGEDERLAGRPPPVERVPHRDGAAASPTGARTARGRPGPERPRARACCWGVLTGDNWGRGGPRVRTASPRPRRASRARAGVPPGSARASRPARITRRTSWGPCGAE